MSKFLITNILLVLLLSLTGCGMVEVEEYSIISGIGVSYENDEYEVTFEIYKENNGETTNLTAITKSAKGKTLSHAISNLSKIMYKQPYLNHCLILLFDKNILEQKLDETLNYFIHDVRIRSSCYLIVSEDLTPKELLEKSKELNYVVSYSLYKQIEHKPSIVGIWSKSNFDFILNERIDKNGIIILPTVKYDNDFDIKGAYAIKNEKEIYYVTPEEILVIQFFRNFVDEGLTNQNNKYIYIKTSQCDLEKKDNEINLIIKLKVITYDYLEINFNDESQKIQYTLELKKSIEENVISIFNKYQELNIDPFAIYRFLEIKDKNYKKIKDNYYEYFKMINLKVSVYIDLLSTGLSEERIE